MVKNAVEMTGLSERVVVDWYNFFREVCSVWLSRDTRPIGGVGHTVQFDATVVSKAKFHRRRYIPARWVFGGYDITTKKSFLVHIPDKKSRDPPPTHPEEHPVGYGNSE